MTPRRRQLGYNLPDLMGAVALLGMFAAVAAPFAVQVHHSARAARGHQEDVLETRRILARLAADTARARTAIHDDERLLLFTDTGRIDYLLEENGRLVRVRDGAIEPLGHRVQRIDWRDGVGTLVVELTLRPRLGPRGPTVRTVLATRGARP